MKLFYCVELTQIRPITEGDRDRLKTVSFDPYELIELKQMNRQDLLALMFFCEIRVFDGMPVIAATDDELRTAYLAWRSIHSAESRKVVTKKVRKISKHLFRATDGLRDWFQTL